MFDTFALVHASSRGLEDDHQALISTLVSHKEPVIIADRGVNSEANKRNSRPKVESVFPRASHIQHFLLKCNLEQHSFLNSNFLGNTIKLEHVKVSVEVIHAHINDQFGVLLFQGERDIASTAHSSSSRKTSKNCYVGRHIRGSILVDPIGRNKCILIIVQVLSTSKSRQVLTRIPCAHKGISSSDLTRDFFLFNVIVVIILIISFIIRF